MTNRNWIKGSAILMLMLFLILFSRYLDIEKTPDHGNKKDRCLPCLKNAPNATKKLQGV